MRRHGGNDELQQVQMHYLQHQRMATTERRLGMVRRQHVRLQMVRNTLAAEKRLCRNSAAIRDIITNELLLLEILPYMLAYWSLFQYNSPRISYFSIKSKGANPFKN
jgi:hypothetical protein